MTASPTTLTPDEIERERGLLPCPFCGAVEPNLAHETMLTDTEAGSVEHIHFIACGSCDAWGPGAQNREEATRLYNARASQGQTTSDDERAKVRREALEEAAKAVDAMPIYESLQLGQDSARRHGLHDAVKTIRSLIDKPTGETG